MAPPVVTSVAPTTAEPRQTVLVSGSNFGQVSGAFFQDDALNLIPATYFQVADGQHVIVTVPSTITTDADYLMVLSTIEDEISTYVDTDGLVHIQPITGVIPADEPVETPDPFPLDDPGDSVGLDRLRKRTRLELSDHPKPFQANSLGDGQTTRFNLPVRHIDADNLIVTKIPADGDADDAVALDAGSDYVLDSFEGMVILTSPLDDGDRLYVTGVHYRFFDNATLDEFIETAFVQIAHGRTITTVSINPFGYRKYGTFQMTFDTLPEVEILPTAILAKIAALWVLATDASYSIDISADGASIPREQRYRQLMGQIQAETARFNDIAEALNIGLHRIEMANLRRISRQTGRLVPLYVEKEYDDRSLPVRVLPGIDHGTGEGTEFIDPYYQNIGP